MILAFNNNSLKGVAVYTLCSNHYTYLMGGTKKEKPELHTGYLLHYHIINQSILEKKVGYDISLGGSKGVINFKSKFNTYYILLGSNLITSLKDFLLFDFFHESLIMNIFT